MDLPVPEDPTNAVVAPASSVKRNALQHRNILFVFKPDIFKIDRALYLRQRLTFVGLRRPRSHLP